MLIHLEQREVSLFTSTQHTLLIFQTKTNDYNREQDSRLQKYLFSSPWPYENTWGAYITTD